MSSRALTGHWIPQDSWRGVHISVLNFEYGPVAAPALTFGRQLQRTVGLLPERSWKAPMLGVMRSRSIEVLPCVSHRCLN
jgi:hypothetical protein